MHGGAWRPPHPASFSSSCGRQSRCHTPSPAAAGTVLLPFYLLSALIALPLGPSAPPALQRACLHLDWTRAARADSSSPEAADDTWTAAESRASSALCRCCEELARRYTAAERKTEGGRSLPSVISTAAEILPPLDSSCISDYAGDPAPQRGFAQVLSAPLRVTAPA